MSNSKWFDLAKKRVDSRVHFIFSHTPMVNRASEESSQRPDFNIDLGVFANNEDAAKLAAALVETLRGDPHANNGFAGRFNLVLSADNQATYTPDVRSVSEYGDYDHSPTGALEREDQMSHGGNGKSGNWITD